MLFHITARANWERAAALGEYAPASLELEGFLHCSTAAQVPATANRIFHGQKNLILLCIDQDKLGAPVRFEPAADANGELFPHIYGPIPVACVSKVVDFPCRPDGSFQLPAELRG